MLRLLLSLELLFLSQKQLLGTPWEDYVKEFRDEHHFSFSFLHKKTTWSFPSQKTTRDQAGVGGLFQYAFYLPIWKQLGWFLGTQLGFSVEESNPTLGAEKTISIPGFLGGLALSFSPRWRLGLGTAYAFDRVFGLSGFDIEGDFNRSSLLEPQGFLVIDFFYDLNWGVRFETHLRRGQILIPSGETSRLKLTSQENWTGVGVIYNWL
jgi:hypothetical protein